MSDKPKVLSLFSGVGGFDLGLERAGMETVFQCEWDKHATKVLERHWPNVPRWGDISTLTGEHILRYAPVVDVVAWGSPCQDLSVAGRRAGLSGERSGLFYEGIRIINELRRLTNGRYPGISIWENVPGALSSNRGSDFGEVLHELDEAGASFSEWRILDAQYFGVPQRRRRVFVVSVFDPATAERCPEPLLSVAQGVRRDSAESEPQGQASADPTAGGVGENGRKPILIDRAAFNQGENAKFDPVISEHPVVPSLVARGPHAVATFTKSKRAQNRYDNETWVEGKLAPTLNAFDVRGTRATALVAFDTQFGSNAHVYTDLAPPIKASQQSPSVAYESEETAGMAVRRLTPVECERLMGWPDDWTAGQADTQRYRQCGNGVASPVAQWIGERIMGVLCDPL
jgi:DNA (cytosine-5)-methyltransferase 1